jgi:hypothetical protein
VGYLVGALVVVFGIALVIAGATGTAGSLFSAVTGKSTPTTSADTTGSNAATLLSALSGSSSPAGTASSAVPTSPILNPIGPIPVGLP